MQKTKILKGEELKRFKEETKINAKHVIIARKNRDYYVVLIDTYLKLRIKEELALQFL